MRAENPNELRSIRVSGSKTENRKPKTENRKPKTENRKPKTENRKPKTENRKPMSDSHSQHPTRNPILRFLWTYVFATDHKIIGLQFLFSSLIWLFVGGLLALAVRWQLAWPWSDMPIFGNLLFAESGGKISPEFYTMLFTMHATIMIFFVVIPILAGGFGNYLIPLMIGAEDMAFPRLNMLSYWLMWPAFGCMILSFFMPGYGPVPVGRRIRR